MPVASNGRLLLNVAGRYRDYPREDFFGLGPDSSRSSFADFRLRGPTVDVRADARVAGPVSIIGGAQYIHPLVSDGKDPSLPSISSVFDETTAPGLDSQPDFVRAHAAIDVDYRQPRNARRGGWYRAEFSHFADRDRQRYSFDRLDIDLRQFVSVLSERRVFVARAYVSTSEPSSGQTIPFYLMPTLGGNETLRGFRDYRFRGAARDAAAGRVSLRGVVGSRRRPLLRHRQGGDEPSGPQLRRRSSRTTASGSASTPTTA